MSSSSGSHRLTLWIAASIVAAVLFALLLPYLPMAQDRKEMVLVPLEIGGEIFLRVLKMLVVPLVVTSVMAGVLGLGDVRNLGRPRLATMAYFLSTTLLAVLLGIVLVNIIRPGEGGGGPQPKVVAKEVLYQHLANDSGLTEEQVAGALGDADYVDKLHPSVMRILRNLAVMMFTDNLFRSAANTDLLPLIVFSIVFAGLLTTMGSRVDGIKSLVGQFNDAFMAFVLLVMRFAPLGIFCLVAARFGAANIAGGLWNELRSVGSYFLTVLIGLGIHGFAVLPLLLWIVTRRNPYRYLVQMSQALLTAFSTASSSATLPVSIECAVDRAKVNRKSVDFVLPLGATINMDGTALYEAVAAIFIAQVVGKDLGFGEQLIVAITATLAAIGAAGIPEAGLVTMVIVLTAVGLPIEYMSLIISVDWLLDRFRTTINVFGDAIGAAVVENTFPPDPATT